MPQSMPWSKVSESDSEVSALPATSNEDTFQNLRFLASSRKQTVSPHLVDSARQVACSLS